MNQPSPRRLPARSRALPTLLGRRPAPAAAAAPERRRFRPRLEVLETRTVPAVLVVGPNVNITRAAGNQAESTISVDPNNPLNLFESDTISGVGHYSLNGG
jgi:hypothetical protein